MAGLEQFWTHGLPSPSVGSPSSTGAEQHWTHGLPAVNATIPDAGAPATLTGIYDQTELGYPLTFMQVQRIELHINAPNSGTAVTYYKRAIADEWRPLYSQAVAATYQRLSLYVWGIPYVKTELTAVASDQAVVRFHHGRYRAT